MGFFRRKKRKDKAQKTPATVEPTPALNVSIEQDQDGQLEVSMDEEGIRKTLFYEDSVPFDEDPEKDVNEEAPVAAGDAGATENAASSTETANVEGLSRAGAPSSTTSTGEVAVGPVVVTPLSKDDKNAAIEAPLTVGASAAAETSSVTPEPELSASQKLMRLLVCPSDLKPKELSRMFYDKVMSPMHDKGKRPYYDEAFSIDFTKDMRTKGVSILYLQAPGSAGNDSEDWKGRSVTLKLEPATHGDKAAMQPRLTWTAAPGGNLTKKITTSVSILKIHSITTSIPELQDVDDDNDEEDMCFMTVTTDHGDVHIFEAATPKQRDTLANGLRNVVARLSFQLISGDVGSMDEFFDAEQAEAPGDLPSLTSPVQNMNRMSLVLLE